MANGLSFRKRIYPIQRAPNGSAFQKCDFCGTNVIFVLFDMHDSECRGKQERLESSDGNKSLKSLYVNARHKSSDRNYFVESSSISLQPRSPFLFFMEDFKRSWKDNDWIQTDREGFQKWKNMSKEERQPYISKADEVNSAYEIGMLDSVEEVDGTDSETVQNYYLEDEEVGMHDSDCYLNFDSYDMYLVKEWI
ncbi:high mobility group B protein 7-like isoform X1 [Aristolochia californica]|uniref:high mobility group B protein 7-like isoform X1 n=1 Tax=Aristolochia californica TaxID=171875 RepID=UPI0035D98738